MSIALAPTTELDAVNEILAAIGEAPVNQLTNLGLQDAAVARSRLYDASRRTQARGWSWNTDFGVSLVPDVNGALWVPNNTLKATFVGNSKGKGLTLRRYQVYDSVNQTRKFTDAAYADVVTMLNFDELPETARQFVFLSAIIRFQAGFIGSEILDKYTARDAEQAWSSLMSEELENADWNLFTDSADMVMGLNRIGWTGGSFS